MARYVKNGGFIQYTASANIDAGDVLVVGGLVCLSMYDIASGEVGSLQVIKNGEFELPKAAEAIAVGEACYWDESNSNVTATSTDNTLVGYAASVAASGDALVRIIA